MQGTAMAHHAIPRQTMIDRAADATGAGMMSTRRRVVVASMINRMMLASGGHACLGIGIF